MKKSLSTDTEKHGRWLPWAAGTLAFAGLAGTLFALSEILESDSDNDGWTDAEEIIAGTNPADETDPWDSDGDGIADYLEFLDGTDPLDPNDPPQARGAWKKSKNSCLPDMFGLNLLLSNTLLVEQMLLL